MLAARPLPRPVRLALRGPRLSPRRLPARAAPSTEATASDPATAHPDAWAACLAALSPLDLPPEDAEDALRVAFGWSRSTYWRGARAPGIPPDPAAVAGALAVLLGPDVEAGDLGMAPPDAAAVVEAFPECLALPGEPGGAIRGVLAKLKQDWKMTGGTAARAVGRTPRVLGYTIDCLGDCVGECDRCWVRF